MIAFLQLTDESSRVHPLVVTAIGVGMFAAGARLLGERDRCWLGAQCVAYGIVCIAIAVGAEIRAATLVAAAVSVSWPATGTPRDRLSLIGGVASGATALLAFTGPTPLSTASAGVAVALVTVTGLREIAGAPATLRRRVDFFSAGVIIDAAFLVSLGVVHTVTGWPLDLRTPAVAAQVILPLALAGSTSSSVVRHAGRLLDVALPRLLVTIGLVALYTVVVEFAAPPPTNTTRLLAGLLVVAASPTIAARVYSPLKQVTNRFLHGSDRSPRHLVDDVRRSFDRRVPDSTILASVVDQLGAEFLSPIALWLNDDTGDHLLAGSVDAARFARPDATTAICTPLIHRGRSYGQLVVGGDDPGRSLNRRDRRLLTDVGGEIARILDRSDREAMLHHSLARLEEQADELQRSRARVVAAADDARRRIERDLHDGAQQDLLGIAMACQNIRTMLGEGALDEAASVLATLEVDAVTTLANVRSLALGVFPPSLGSGGLAEALVGAAERSPLRVELDLGMIGRHHPDVEAAVYFCCVEALQNAAKHAGDDATAVVAVHRDGDRVRFSVTDDGVGFDSAAIEHRHGLENMADRVFALGGEFAVDSTVDTGTTISGAVPLGE